MSSDAFDQPIYDGTWYGGLFKTTNGGASWSAVNAGLTTLPVTTLAIDTHDGGTLYAGTPGGAFAMSMDGEDASR